MHIVDIGYFESKLFMTTAKKIFYCSVCTMPSTRPGITFDEHGVCCACQSFAKRKNIDWDKRWAELQALCDKYRGINGPNGYDCMIAVSGGKDSHYQTHVMKNLMGMNPLLVSVYDNFPMTEAGRHNIKNISEVFGCDIIAIHPNIKIQKILMRKTFEQYGKPTYMLDRYIYTYPLHMAVKFNTPLLVYGENVSYEYGGQNASETYSARDQITNGVASGIEADDLIDEQVGKKDLNFFDPPPESDLNKLEPIYLGYFVPWNSFYNYELAKNLGFHDLTHEWNRTHHIENFDQIDSRAYLVHSWMKYPKFGHGAATDYSARMIRYGLISREEGFAMVQKHDHALDPLCVRDFCNFVGYSEKEFWEIVEKFYSRDLFEKNANGRWVLKRK